MRETALQTIGLHEKEEEEEGFLGAREKESPGRLTKGASGYKLDLDLQRGNKCLWIKEAIIAALPIDGLLILSPLLHFSVCCYAQSLPLSFIREVSNPPY